MTEKEFLEEFIEFLDKENYDINLGSLTIKSIQTFLEEHHKEYYEVEFVKKEIIGSTGMTVEEMKEIYNKNA